MKHVEKDFFACIISAIEQSIFENALYHAALFDDIPRLFRAEQQCLAAVIGSFSAFQIALQYQFVYIDGYEVRFDLADLDNITGGPVLGIVAEEHENVKSCLRFCNVPVKTNVCPLNLSETF